LRTFTVPLDVQGTEEEVTWQSEYNDGQAAERAASTGLQYTYTLYWSVTTMTTIGYGDLIPQNDAERVFAVFAMLAVGMVFGYLLSNVGVLIASMDRQAAVIEEKMDVRRPPARSREHPACDRRR
jgi:voltage-gated potassium channel Kch